MTQTSGGRGTSGLQARQSLSRRRSPGTRGPGVSPGRSSDSVEGRHSINRATAPDSKAGDAARFRWPPLCVALFIAAIVSSSLSSLGFASESVATASARPVLDPSARLLEEDDASEYWTLFVELETGHRITQRFLLSNAGPGKHNAVAVGHITELGRAPYRYENGRRKSRWTLSEDRLFFDIAASHLDLHRPEGELRITKDDIEIRLFFDFPPDAPSVAIPAERLPPDYHVEVLAVGAATTGTIEAPWMIQPIETKGHTWLVHTWTERDEATLLDRRTEIYGQDTSAAFYGIHLQRGDDSESGWALLRRTPDRIIESSINKESDWHASHRGPHATESLNYPIPHSILMSEEKFSGLITLAGEWLRYDPLSVIPQPFRWFIRRKSKPQEVWADAQIGVSLLSAPETPSLPEAGKRERGNEESNERRTSHPVEVVDVDDRPNSKRETENETATRSVTGVASVTFLNPLGRR